MTKYVQNLIYYIETDYCFNLLINLVNVFVLIFSSFCRTRWLFFLFLLNSVTFPGLACSHFTTNDFKLPKRTDSIFEKLGIQERT
ncbi:hypothetical protein VNO77_33661 [Canavalia gladiata]|uniref:Uncharacterized protein n=1 Tax=Canavalia gladiata TaxID=3824 RepID=A0AAN9KG44_CANGL